MGAEESPVAALPGAPRSFWVHTSPETAYPPLEPGLSVDVAVIGGGITGLTTATLLKRAGARVAVIEARRLATGVTGYTTGKLTSLHGLIYATLASKLGEEAARFYGEANQGGIERVAAFVEEQGIDCDFERLPAYTYTEKADEVGQIESEVEAATRAGLPAAYTDQTELPYSVRAAIRFDAQARFHPRKYCLALAGAIPGDGSHVFEETRAVDVKEGSPCRLVTDQGELRAERVVVATSIPFLDRGFFFAKTHPMRSYVLGLRLEGDVPRGMFITAGPPTRSLRPHPAGDGEVLLLSGEGHKTGQAKEHAERYRRLERFARERFELRAIDYRWSTQDYYPLDGVPYIGRLRRRSERIYVATGFKAWGLAHGTVAGLIISDQVAGRESPWAELYDPNRLRPGAAGKDFLKENANVAGRFFGDRVTKRQRESPDDLSPGEGRVLSSGRRQIAAYKDPHGEIRQLSARCTHMGCIVSWNDAERTWDCPCHGSRFSVEGKVIQGPAVADLRAL